MNRVEIFEALEEILRDHCEISTDKVNMDSHLFSDLELDSMALLTMVTEIENCFQIFLNEDPDNPPQTVKEIIDLVEKRVNNV